MLNKVPIPYRNKIPLSGCVVTWLPLGVVLIYNTSHCDCSEQILITIPHRYWHKSRMYTHFCQVTMNFVINKNVWYQTVLLTFTNQYQHHYTEWSSTLVIVKKFDFTSQWQYWMLRISWHMIVYYSISSIWELWQI